MKRVPHGAWRRAKGEGSRFGIPRSTFGIVMLWLVVWLGATAAAPSSAGDAPAHSTGSGQPFDRLRAGAPNLGIEGRASLTLPGPDYRPRPLDDRTELILRVEKIVPLTNGQHRYEFYYMGLEPGAYRLMDFLIRPDGTRPEELGEHSIQVRALLPEEHDGRLNAHFASRFPFIGGYRALLVVLATAWVGGIAAFIYVSRRKPLSAQPVVVAPPLSLAEQIRPLIDAAVIGKLSVDGQAQLERFLIMYWREKLVPTDLRMAESLAQVKQHGEAGALVLALERWLHRPGGMADEEVTACLEPYRQPQPADGLTPPQKEGATG
jgi:hypothetical protein